MSKVIEFKTIHKNTMGTNPHRGSMVIEYLIDVPKLRSDVEITEEILENKMLIAVFMGAKPTSGHSIEIEKVTEYDDHIMVTVKEQGIGANSIINQVITSPFHIISIPLTDKEIHFDYSLKVTDKKWTYFRTNCNEYIVASSAIVRVEDSPATMIPCGLIGWQDEIENSAAIFDLELSESQHLEINAKIIMLRLTCGTIIGIKCDSIYHSDEKKSSAVPLNPVLNNANISGKTPWAYQLYTRKNPCN